MHPVQIVFILICLTLLAFALLWVAGKAAERVQQRQVFRRARPVGYVEKGAASEPSNHRDAPPSEARPTALDGAAPASRDGMPDEPLHLTSVEIVRALAAVKRIDSDGNVEWLSKDRIASVAGLRAADARAIIDEVRGTPPASKPAAPTTPYAGRPYDPTHYEHEVTA